MNDAQAIRAGVKAICNRKLAAIDNFLAYVKEQTGCTDEQAAKVWNIYRKEKLVSIDSYNGTWHIKHGVFLDVDVLRNAINL